MTDPRVPAGLGPMRRALLQVALAELDAGAKEEPPGSNRGPRVDLYVPRWALRASGRKGPSWCAFFVGRVSSWALGRFLPGGHLGSCDRLMKAAKKAGRWRPKGAVPRPGDAFIMDTDGARGNHGHTGFVLRVGAFDQKINTVEGNSGNRVRLGRRSLSDERILGWIDTVPEEPGVDFERGLIPAPDLGARATR